MALDDGRWTIIGDANDVAVTKAHDRLIEAMTKNFSDCGQEVMGPRDVLPYYPAGTSPTR